MTKGWLKTIWVKLSHRLIVSKIQFLIKDIADIARFFKENVRYLECTSRDLIFLILGT